MTDYSREDKEGSLVKLSKIGRVGCKQRKNTAPIKRQTWCGKMIEILLE